MRTSESGFRVACVVGARPNFMKIAPIMKAFAGTQGRLQARLVHTGQHYDEAMKAAFFKQLGIPEPDVDLGVGSASHAVQTAEIMKRFEPEVDTQRPDAVLVVGDVNSTIACALVAAKKGIPVIHVEAGLRSYDRTMPEEINRILTDQLSDLLFATEHSGVENLTREGIDPSRIFLVGNVMIDTLRAHLAYARKPAEVLGPLAGGRTCLESAAGYGLVTLHRPANVDDPLVLGRLLKVMGELATEIPLVFPVHPRTQANIRAFGLDGVLSRARILVLPPLGYLETLGLMAEARLVLSDSGGIQEETTALGVPCLTLRENTERPVTVEQGTNTVVGADPSAIWACAKEILTDGGKKGRIPELWDGQAAERIAGHLLGWFGARANVSP